MNTQTKLFSLALIALTLLGGTAKAASLIADDSNTETAQLTSINLDANYNFFRIGGGRAEMTNTEVSVVLYPKVQECPAHHYCSRLMLAPKIFTAKILRREKACGSDIITAVTDQRPVDGLRTEIVVTDYRGNYCDMVQTNKAEITVKQDGLRGPNYSSSFASKTGFFALETLN